MSKGILVTVNGMIESPENECSAHNNHYVSLEIEEVKIKVDPNKKLLPCLRKLIGTLRNCVYGEGIDYFPKNRVNLLYESGDKIEADLSEIVKSNFFDIFVGPKYGFRQHDKRFRVRGSKINLTEAGMNKNTLSKDIFGLSYDLQISLAGTPGSAFTTKDDFDIIIKYQKDERAYFIKKDYNGLIRKLADSIKSERDRKEVRSYLRKLKESNLKDLEKRVLFTVADLSDNPEEAQPESIFEAIKSDNYYCGCYYDDYKDECPSEVNETLDKLVEVGLINKHIISDNLDENEDRIYRLPLIKIPWPEPYTNGQMKLPFAELSLP